MNEDLQKLIESKKKNDKKQRTLSLAIVFVSLTLLIIIFYSITQKQKTNQLQKENELKDALLKIETQNGTFIKINFQ